MRKFKDYLLDNKFAFLFVVLIGYFLLSAFLENTATRYVFSLLFSFVLLGSLVVVSEARMAVLGSAILFSVISIITLATGLTQMSREILLLQEGLSAVFLTLITVASAHTTYAYKAVDTQTIFGAMCTYLLMGLVWAELYLFIYTFDPSAINLTKFEGTNRFLQHTFTYFSYVTLTTLGYGDILPVSAPARTLAWLEAVVGQAYLTILIAQIVGQFIAQKKEHA